jgi:hypothetical protein
VVEHDEREQQLLVAREARQIAVLEQIRAVLVVAGVRDAEADLVEARGPAEVLARGLVIELPRERDLLEERVRRGLDAPWCEATRRRIVCSRTSSVWKRPRRS